MERLKITFFSAVLASFIAATVFSCKKEEVEKAPVANVDTDVSSASDNNLVERIINDITNIGAQISDNQDFPTIRSVSYASISRDTINKSFTVYFNGQAGFDGLIRSGSLTYDYSVKTSVAKLRHPSSINYTKGYRNPGFNLIVTANNYVVDGNSVSIHRKSITNITDPNFIPNTTNIQWNLIDSITVVKANNSGIIKWYSNRIHELMNTSDTSVYHGSSHEINWEKAIIGMTGNATGITAQNESFTANITSQLQVDYNCAPNTSFPAYHPLIKGTLEFTPGTRATRVINYSYPNYSSCDDSVSISINGKLFLKTIY